MAGTSYSRKLSRGEIAEGRVLIDKRRWSLFPPPGRPLSLEVAGRMLDVALEAEDCVCRPPAHQHYHLPVAAFRDLIGFRAGASITLERLSEAHFHLSQP